MSAPLDVAGILERAGADANAPEGSQAWALAQVGAAVAGLVEASRAFANDDRQRAWHSMYRPMMVRLHAALARFGGA